MYHRRWPRSIVKLAHTGTLIRTKTLLLITAVLLLCTKLSTLPVLVLLLRYVLGRINVILQSTVPSKYCTSSGSRIEILVMRD
eukprot:SAG11_NODE_4068_length_2080_cov_9.321050_1_plen_83_part_00